MNGKKAIEILTLMGSPDFDGHTEDIQAAKNLGVEALRRLVARREAGQSQGVSLLPSETED